MATDKRTYPNDYFTWYNDDNRLAILCEDTTATSGERIKYKSKYGTIDAQDEDLYTEAGLDSGLHPAIVCYIKARMFEDAGDLQRAQYFRAMFDKMIKQYPLRKSGVRTLAVPRL